MIYKSNEWTKECTVWVLYMHCMGIYIINIDDQCFIYSSFPLKQHHLHTKFDGVIQYRFGCAAYLFWSKSILHWIDTKLDVAQQMLNGYSVKFSIQMMMLLQDRELNQIKHWWDNLQKNGPLYGYHPCGILPHLRHRSLFYLVDAEYRWGKSSKYHP